MKLNKPIMLLIPTLFMIEFEKYIGLNKPTFKYDIVYFYYVIHYLSMRQIQTRDKEVVNINTKYLQSVTVWNINKYINILINGEFITSNNYGYKLNSNYVHGASEIRIEPNNKMFKKQIKAARLKKSHYSRMPFYLQEMKDKFMSLDFDYKAAKKWIEAVPDDIKQYSYLSSINQLQDYRFRYFKRNATNQRLDTNLTNLKSDLKQFMIGDFVSIDLANSQPLFLALFLAVFFKKGNIKSNNNNKTTPPNPIVGELCTFNVPQTLDISTLKKILLIRQKAKNGYLANLRLYFESVLKGKFYDDFITHFSGEISRKEVKQIMFKVLFSRNIIYSNHRKFIPFQKEKEIFKTVFPFINEVVEIMKNKNHAKLAIQLQKMESYVFIDIISKRLVEAKIVPLTIHDSVIVDAKQKTKALEIMKQTFIDIFNVVPTFHVENIKKNFNNQFN